MTKDQDLTEYEQKLLGILDKERAARKDAEKQMKYFRKKFYDKRDQAELWEYRAIRYSNQLRTLRAKSFTQSHNNESE